MRLADIQIEALKRPIDSKWLKPHPTKKVGKDQPMTVINPMAVIERLNEVFGFGGWQMVTRKQGKLIITTDYNKYTAMAKVTLIVPSLDIVLEQFGGSSNSDAGDALKGAATDALTKCASYLGIGFDIYAGQADNVPADKDKTTGGLASDKQKGLIRFLLKEKQPNEKGHAKIERKLTADLTSKEASDTIDWLNKQPKK